MHPVTASVFTSALAHAASSVSLVTSEHEGRRAGLTVSSFCSVCADPALMLACVNADNEFCEVAEAAGHFAINLLPESAEDLALVFAGLGDDPDAPRFEHGHWTELSTGAPVLTDALVALDCLIDSVELRGSHKVYYGKVVDVRTPSGGVPLLYSNRGFGRLHLDPPDGPHAGDFSASDDDTADR